MKELEKMITPKTKVMSFAHLSNNVVETENVKEITTLLKKHNVISILDAAQSLGHIEVDVKDLGIDFLIAAPHKMYAAVGVGILYGRYDLLKKIRPVFVGGGNSPEIIDNKKIIYRNLPYRLEAGTPNIAGILSLTPAINYIKNIGLDNI
jgi:cysteine desulfurase/selenocysteine lyase